MLEDFGGFAQTYGVELLYDTPPKISSADVASYVKKRCLGAELANNGENDRSLYFFIGTILSNLRTLICPHKLLTSGSTLHPRRKARKV
jgi:hypothetical protein